MRIKSYILPLLGGLKALDLLLINFKNGHVLIRAQSELDNEEFSDDLKNLIRDIKHDTKRFTTLPKIDFFVVSSADIYGYGISGLKCTIALPRHFNYNETDNQDIHVKDLEMRTSLTVNVSKFLDFFRKDSELKWPKVNKFEYMVKHGIIREYRVNLKNIKGQEEKYKSCLKLSDSAKKYAIAHQIFLNDSYKPVAQSFNFAFSSCLPIFFTRSLLKIENLRVTRTRRLFVYATSAYFGYEIYKLLRDRINSYYFLSAQTSVLLLGTRYVDGYIEYNAKKKYRELLTSLDVIKAYGIPLYRR